MKHLIIVLALSLLAACDEEAVPVPGPVALTEGAVSHFCMMDLSEHGGPKAQVHLARMPGPLFFAQVRDGLAFLNGPEREADIAAAYVSDMTRAASWEDPGNDNWIPVATAHFVVGADVTGGMGAPEIVPFGTRSAAESFAAENGGTVMGLDEIPDEAVLGPVEIRLEGERK